MKQTGTVNGNEFLRRRLGEDKNRTVKVDISKFMDIQEHDELIEEKQQWLDIMLFVICFIIGMLIVQFIINKTNFPIL